MKAGVCASSGRLYRGAQFPADLPFFVRGASIQILQSDVVFGVCGGVGTLRLIAHPGIYRCTEAGLLHRASENFKEIMNTRKMMAATKNGDF